MANNYIVTTYTQQETPGDQFDGTISNSYSFTNPDPGTITQPMLSIQPDNTNSESNTIWYVSTVNFSISGGTPTGYSVGMFGNLAYEYWNGQNGVTLPDEVEYVTMEDSLGDYNPTNVIIVKVFLYQDWEMPNSDWTVNIDIDGTAMPWVEGVNNYEWGVALTNGIWPGGNDQTTWSNNDIINNNGTPVINSTGDFYLANYNQQTADAWNFHEARRRQNPNAIPNCVIQQINSPIQAPIDDILDDNGVGHTWFSNDQDIPCNVQFRIKPASPAWKISIEDFSIMTSGVQRMIINEPPYEEGFAYFTEGTANTGVFVIENAWWNPFYQANNWPWNPIFNNLNTNTVELCEGTGEPLSQPPENPFSVLPMDQDYWTDYILTPQLEYAWFNTGSINATPWDMIYGADPYVGSNYNDQWPALTGWLSQNDVDTFVGDVGWNCGSGWDTTTGLINSGGVVKHYMEPIVFRLTGYANNILYIDPNTNQEGSYIDGSISYQYNLANMDLNNYVNPYSPLVEPPNAELVINEDGVSVYTNTGQNVAVKSSNTSIGMNAYDHFISAFSGAAGFDWIRTILMEETNPGENDNNIIVTIIPKPQGWTGGFTVDGSEYAYNDGLLPWYDDGSNETGGMTGTMRFSMLQINGRATPAGQGAPPPINAGFNLISDSNSGNITVTRTSNSKMSENVENLLQPTQRNTYSFSARIPNNELTNLATIKVEAEEGYHLAEIPYLSIDNTSPNLNFDIGQNIQLKLSESTSNTSYTFDLLYKNNESISVSDDLNININFRSLVTQTRALEIRNITFGNQTVSAGGESRNITIYGKPGTPFELLVNSVDENLDSDDRVVDSTEESIISNRISNSEVVIGTGKTFNQLSEKIHSTGKYSFNQTIPNTTIRSTAINGSMASGGATKIIFDDLTYVRVGDQVVMKEITSGFITVTELNPDGDNENECTVSASITAADNALVSFKRSKKYRIHVKPGTDASVNTTGAMASWSTDIDGWSGYYSKDMNQYLNPVLTLRATTSEGAGVMTMNGATWNSSTPYDLTYVGRPNTLQSKIQGKTGVPATRFTLTYLLDLVNPARNFAYVDTIDPAPAFSSDVEFINTTETPQVDWTNTTPELNGGTIIHMSNIAITAAGANTITITANVELVKWGSSNVIMELNLDNIVSNS